MRRCRNSEGVDWWALGVLLYWYGFGRHPFSQDKYNDGYTLFTIFKPMVFASRAIPPLIVKIFRDKTRHSTR